MPDAMMKKGSKRMWRIAPKDNTGAITVADPKHRAVAVGLSSGVSLRNFPKSTVQKVRRQSMYLFRREMPINNSETSFSSLGQRDLFTLC